jgi:hypothetical protein
MHTLIYLPPTQRGRRVRKGERRGGGEREREEEGGEEKTLRRISLQI